MRFPPVLQGRQPTPGTRPVGDFARARLLVLPWEGGSKYGTLNKEPCAAGLAWSGVAAAGSGNVVTGVPASGYPVAIAFEVLVRDTSTNNIITTWGNVSDGRRIQIDVSAGQLRAIQVGSSTQSISTPVVANTIVRGVYVARSATDRALFVNGRLVGTGAASCTTSAFDRVGVLFGVNQAYPGGTQEINGLTTLMAFMAHRISDADARAMSADPWGQFESERRIWLPQEAPSGSNVTLSIEDASHGHSADAISLVTGSVLSIADAAHALSSDEVALSSSSTVVLSIEDASHAHAATEPTLSTSDSLALDIEDASHGHTADSIALTSGSVLAIADASHAHAAEEPSLSTAVWLSISDASHGHQAGEPALTESGGGGAVDIPPQRRLRAIPGGSTAYRVPSSQTDFCALDF